MTTQPSGVFTQWRPKARQRNSYVRLMSASGHSNEGTAPAGAAASAAANSVAEIILVPFGELVVHREREAEAVVYPSARA